MAILSQTQRWTPAPACSVCRVRLSGALAGGNTAPKAKRAAAKAGQQPVPPGRDLGLVFEILRVALADQRRARFELRRNAELTEQLEARWHKLGRNILRWTQQASQSGAFLAAVEARHQLARLTLSDEYLTDRQYAQAVAGTRWQRTDLRTGEDWW